MVIFPVTFKEGLDLEALCYGFGIILTKCIHFDLQKKLRFPTPCSFKTEELLSIRHVFGPQRPWGGFGRNSKALYEPNDVPTKFGK